MPGPSAQKRGKSAPPKQSKAELAKAMSRARRGDDASNPSRKHDYDLHRDRVNSVKALVDSSSPIVIRNTYTTPANFNRSIKNFVNIERENARMLGRIAQIMKDPATVDNRLGRPSRVVNMRGHYRDKQFLKIAFENMEMHKRIQSTKPVYSRAQQLKDFAEAEKVMELTSFYPLYWKPNPNGPLEDHRSAAMANAQNNPRPTVFLDLETDEDTLGQIVIELRADVVPMTAENFRCLCTGEMGPSYKCSQIRRVVPDILWQGGDTGQGGSSVFGSLPDENFKLKHDEKGVVSMCNSGPDSGGSQFMIIAKKISALDGVNVVVGKVTSGIGILESLNDLVSQSGSLKKKVWISNCGSTDGDGGGDENGNNDEGSGDNKQNQIEDKKTDKKKEKSASAKSSKSKANVKTSQAAVEDTSEKEPAASESQTNEKPSESETEKPTEDTANEE